MTADPPPPPLDYRPPDPRAAWWRSPGVRNAGVTMAAIGSALLGNPWAWVIVERAVGGGGLRIHLAALGALTCAGHLVAFALLFAPGPLWVERPAEATPRDAPEPGCLPRLIGGLAVGLSLLTSCVGWFFTLMMRNWNPG